MCTKTKTIWGCGCSVKDSQPTPCDKAKRLRSICPDYERFLFKRDDDCRECRAGRDPIGRGSRGESRYAKETRRQGRKEGFREAYGDTYDRDTFDRGRSAQPKPYQSSRRNENQSGPSGKKGGADTGDDDGPEEIEYEYSWDSPNTGKKSKVADEDVDFVIDLTPPEPSQSERRYRGRRSSMPAEDYAGHRFGKSEYERSRDEYYRNKERSRYEKRHPRRRNSLDTEVDFGLDAELPPRPRHSHHRGGRGVGDHGYQSSSRRSGLHDLETDFGYGYDDFDYDISPGLGSTQFPRSYTHCDGYMDSFFSSSGFDDSFGRRRRY